MFRVISEARVRVDPLRRRLLIGLGTLPLLGIGLAACGAETASKSGPDRFPDPDSRVRWRATRGEQSLLALHAAIVAKHPSLATSLEPFTAHHTEHVAALEAEGPLPIGADGVPAPTAVEVPDDADAALVTVREAERAAAEARITDCLAAKGPQLAVLLSSVGAAEAAHDVALALA